MKKIFGLRILLVFIFTSFLSINVYSQLSWQQFPNLYGNNMVMMAGNSNGDLFAGSGTSGVFKSTDGGSTWVQTNNGLSDNDVVSIAINNNNDIFAGTFSSGIFRSTDNGGSWSQINSGLTLFNIRSIIFNPDSGFVFACAGPTPFSGAVYRSSNNGDTWIPVNTGLPFGAMFSLAIDSNNYIYAGSGFNGGVYVSTNNGENWTSAGLANQSVLSLAVDKANNIIYAGTYNTVFKSTDNGSTWSSTGLSGNIWAITTNNAGDVFVGTWAGEIYRSSDNGTNWTNLASEMTIVQDIFISQNGNLYASTFSAGIFKSTDNGLTWLNSSDGLGSLNVNSIAVAPNGSIFAGGGMLYRSTDSGTNWKIVKGGSGNSIYSSIAISNQGDIFAAVGGASGGRWIYRSTNNGNSWTKINNGLTDSTVSVVKLDSLGNIFIGTESGVFRSTDNGDSWTPMNSGLTSTKVRALAFKTNNLIFAGTYPTGLFRSTDGGNSWVSILNGISTNNLLSLAVDGAGNLFTGSMSGGGIYRSTDNGNNWVETDSGVTDLNILSLTAEGNDIYAGTGSGGVFHSSDNGGIWTSMNEGFQTLSSVSALLISNNNIYAGTKGLWYRPLTALPPSAPSNLQASADTMMVTLTWQDNSSNEDGFVIERKQGDSTSTNTYVVIDSIGANITSYTDTSFTVDTLFTYRVYAYNQTGESGYSNQVTVVVPLPVELMSFTANINGGSVMLNWSTATETNNRGFEVERYAQSAKRKAWEKIGFVQGNGTTTQPETYSFSDKNVTSGTYSYRLKQIDFNGTYSYSKTIEANVNAPSQFSLSQNYPNPFNPTTTIDYSIPKDGNVNLSVYNILGQQVVSLVNGNKKAGQYHVTFNAANLASGIYYYRLTSGNNVSVKKMILLK